MRTLPKRSPLARLLNPDVARTVEESIRSRKADCRACELHLAIVHLLAERGITVSHEAICLWCIKFGVIYTRRLKRKHQGYGDTFYIDEVFTGVPDHSDQWRAAFGGCREVNLLVPLDFFGPEELTCQYPDIHLIAALDYLNTL